MTDRGAIGAVGTIVVPTRGPDGPGEVMLNIGGVRECYFADSDTPLDRGQSVMVVEVAPHRHVTVVPWADFPVPQ
ncbi:hypothetical protein SAMN04515671_4034 [Nakamurella panacisegetis]|uniref:Uncharacterized protein n=1 Tax=Nakamurella panacisegetis TaxID=1090615 RepID=A0A1H0SD08_9ACTN|nr:hypothetical protein [Nakamurella panacisegetis]SDP39545.1 hypothetical protein SAMN04515671_4034 [Nakamurella panacisegetis]